MVRFLSKVEPTEPMRGLEVPQTLSRRSAAEAATSDGRDQRPFVEDEGRDHAWPVPDRPE